MIVLFLETRIYVATFILIQHTDRDLYSVNNMGETEVFSKEVFSQAMY